MRRSPTLLLTAALACVLWLGGTREARANLGDALFLPPHDDYQQLETPHFVVVYPAIYEREARAAADYAEDVHGVLTKAFKYAPNHKCHLILTDNEDFANGVTSPIGQQGIVLYLTAPDPYSSIGEYDHWLRHLFMHEYAHYVTLTQARGIYELGSYLFGELLYPNAVWPIWISEGMAVYAESVFTREGRGHGTYYSTLTRDAIARGTLGKSSFLEFDKLTGPVPDYPFGEAPYYAGYAMIDEMIVKHGADAPARFSEESSWRLPFLNDGTLENIAVDRSPEASSFEGLWASWIERQTKIMAPDLAWLKLHGSPEPAFLTPEGTASVGTRLSPDATRVAYAQTSGHERPALYVQTRATGEKNRLEDAIAGPGIAWSSDGRKLYYAKSDHDGPYDFYSDLFEYDLDRGSSRRLSRGLRAKDPDLCQRPGGADVLIYGTQRGRISELREFELATGTTTLLYTAPDDHHIANPRCTPDGSTVVFSEHGTEPRDAMMSITRSTGGSGRGAQATHLFGGPGTAFAALFPEPVANGDIYFTRARDDFYELARFDARTRGVRLVARGTGGYWLPSVRNGLMSVSYLSSTGVRVAVVDPAKLEAAINQTSSPEPIVAPQLTHQPETPSPRVKTTEPKGYNLLSSLQPRIWAPYIQLATNQDQFGAEVLGWDDLDQLEYTAFLWYDSVPRKPEGILATYHRVKTFKLGLAGSSQISQFAVAGDGTRVYNEERKVTATLSRPFPFAFENFTPTALAEWARISRGGDYGTRTYQPDERLGLELTYDNRVTTNHSLTPESGLYLDANGRRFFSSPSQAWKGLFTVNPVISLFPRHANLSLNAMYGVGPNPTDNIIESFVRVGGHGSLSDLDPPLRGYPLGNFATQRAAILQAEYRLPIAQVFRGYGTWPLFLRNLGVFGFYDAAKLQYATTGYTPLVDAVGGGLILNPTLAYSIPVRIQIEFAHGFKHQLNGQDIISAGLQL